ncbi:MAG TPA: GHMP kinase [Anaerolineales bacterium]|jgi:D-glycero-alpha-D-manno-heptose-7-phosphate kinase|nr:GHMP kinase [Anaerolineales bacterium]
MIVVRTPLRVSFLGGGTDFPEHYREHGGAVISTAIDKYIYVIVKQRFDDMVYVNYSKKEIVENADELQHELVREAMRVTGVKRGVEITTLADVPSSGTGLGSSSSVTVGLLQALHSYRGQLVTAKTLARQACEIEIERCGKPIGVQDQYIAAYGGLRELIFCEDDDVQVAALGLDDELLRRLNRNMMLFYTHLTRPSGSVLSEQRENIGERRASLFGLRDLATQARDCLRSGDLTTFGELLHQGWELKKGLASGVSNRALDEYYGVAQDAGALGGKISGAGGGGFLLLYCPLAAQDDVRQALSTLRELPFTFERDGSRVVFNLGR